MSVQQSELVERIVFLVGVAYDCDQPIEYATGPFADRRVKRALGLGGIHQSVVCRAINQAIDDDRIVIVPAGTTTA